MPSRPTRHLLAVLALTVALAACSGDPEPAPSPDDLSDIGTPAPTTETTDTGTDTPTGTATADVGDTSRVDLDVIPDQIDDTYVAALVDDTLDWVVDGARDVEDGALGERGLGLTRSRVDPRGIERTEGIIVDLGDLAADGAGDPTHDLLRVGTATATCVSADVRIDFRPFAPTAFAGEVLDYWLVWLPQPAEVDAPTAWYFFAIAAQVDGGQEADPCAA